MNTLSLTKCLELIPPLIQLFTTPGNEKKVVVGMQNGPLELLDKELEPLQVFPAGNRWNHTDLSFLTGFSYLLERSLSSSSIWSIFLSKSGTWYSQHGLDLDFDHLKNNWWSPLTRSHTCCKASRCTGPKGPWVDIWWWPLFSSTSLSYSLSNYHNIIINILIIILIITITEAT